MGQPQALRRQNRQQVIELLLLGESLTRPQLAERSRLSKVTVNVIVQELQQRGLVILHGGASQGLGRVPQRVSLHPGLGNVAGLDVQREVLMYQLVSLSGRVLQEGRQAVQGDLSAAVLHLLDRLGDFGPLLNVVLGLPAPVDRAGRPSEPNALPELNTEALQAALHDRATQMQFENDANLAAVATAQRRPDVGFVAVLLARESGTGLGLLLNGELYRGAGGRAGELGRTPWPRLSSPDFKALELIEHLPSPQRQQATAYALATLTHSLDLELLLIGCAAQEGADLLSRVKPLLPSGVDIQLDTACENLVREGAATLALQAGRAALLRSLNGVLSTQGEVHVA